MFLKTPDDLADVLQTAPSEAAILNRPQLRDDDEIVLLGEVLSSLLNGPTRSFTALVGYFGHRVDAEVIQSYSEVYSRSDLQDTDRDLAELIVHETIEGLRQQMDDFRRYPVRPCDSEAPRPILGASWPSGSCVQSMFGFTATTSGGAVLPLATGEPR